MKENTTLEDISIKGNELGNDGVAAICEALSQRQGGNVKALEFANNSIGPEGAVAISELIRSVSTLESLNIYMNDIGDSGAFKLATALDGKDSLMTLDIGGITLVWMERKQLLPASRAIRLSGHWN